MIFTETAVRGAYLIEMERREDARGFFSRVWCQKEFEKHDLNGRLAQMNTAMSLRKGCLRGMHYQMHPCQEAKTVWCTVGAIYDVVLDLRKDSPSYKSWAHAELTAANGRMLYVPEGCAHGYQTLSDGVEMYYFASEFYAPQSARGVRYNDPVFGITWPLPVSDISDADRNWPDYLD